MTKGTLGLVLGAVLILAINLLAQNFFAHNAAITIRNEL
jgi:hypothetical protein